MDWKTFTLKVKTVSAIKLFTVAGTQITVSTLLTFVAILVATFYVSHIMQRGLDRVLARRGINLGGNLGAGKRLLHYVVVLVGLGIALESVGINFNALFAAGAFFAVAIGFAMQTITQNFVSGVILLVERIIRPDDIIDLNGVVAKVETMGIRATIVRTLDEEKIIVPNSLLVQNPMKSFTLGDNLYRVRGLVGVVYGADMRKVRSVLEAVAKQIDWSVPGREPRILLKEFADSSVVWEVSVWIEDPWRCQKRRSDLLEAIWFAFLDEHITIAFPQLDIHLDPPVNDAITRVAQLRAAG